MGIAELIIGRINNTPCGLQKSGQLSCAAGSWGCLFHRLADRNLPEPFVICNQITELWVLRQTALGIVQGPGC